MDVARRSCSAIFAVLGSRRTPQDFDKSGSNLWFLLGIETLSFSIKLDRMKSFPFPGSQPLIPGHLPSLETQFHQAKAQVLIFWNC